jgi:hypothetical protein
MGPLGPFGASLGPFWVPLGFSDPLAFPEGPLCSHVFPSLPLPFRVAELEELDEIAVAKFSALEELDDCTDVIVAHRQIATEECLCFC